MNAALVRDLVRMGLAVGAHVEHPVTPELINGLARDLAQPVIDAMGAEGAPAAWTSPRGDAFATPPCSSLHAAYGQCVLGGLRHVEHGTHDGNNRWRHWTTSQEV